MSLEGKLNIDLEAATAKVVISSSRPVQAADRLFSGRHIEEVLSLLPLLYNVCGTAQAYAARSAFESISDNTADAEVQATRQHLLWLEIVREHSWHILRLWSKALGEAQNIAALQAFMKAKTSMVLETLMEREIFGIPLEQWRDLQSFDALQTWINAGDTVAARLLAQVQQRGWANIGHCDIKPLPALSTADLQQRLDSKDAAAFITAPDWQGCYYETTAFARQKQQIQPLLQTVISRYGNGLFSRLLARLLELAWGMPANVQAELGISQVETARGRLIHRIQLDSNYQVIRYQIVAPTEWNFHPQGVLAQSLKNLLKSASVDITQAHWLVQAIDPCVGYDLTMRH